MNNKEMKSFHIYMPIESAEDFTDAELEGAFVGAAADIRQTLKNMRSAGMEVIPSPNCDNRDAAGRCLGHPAIEGGSES